MFRSSTQQRVSNTEQTVRAYHLYTMSSCDSRNNERQQPRKQANQD
jgi:hypothetical protein